MLAVFKKAATLFSTLLERMAKFFVGSKTVAASNASGVSAKTETPVEGKPMPALLPTWLLWLLSPLGKYLALAAVALAAYGAWNLSIRHDERQKVYAKQEVQRTNA